MGIKKVILGISDVKNLFQSLKANYSIDFFDYALSSMKRRIESFMHSYFLSSIDELIHRLEKDTSFFEMFLKSILVDETEMFRDPEFWDEFKNIVLKKYRYATEIKVWVPEANSGEELYSLLIILDQLNLLERSNIYVSSMSVLNIEKIKKASFDQKRMEINVANFQRFEEGGNLNQYFTLKGSTSILNPELMSVVRVEKHNIFAEESTEIFDIVLFRNKMLYYNPQLRIEALKKLTKHLRPGGYISMGVKELLDYPSWENDYIVFSESEKIYKKILK